MTAATASAGDVPEALTLFLREIGRYPLLDAREEIRLARRIERGDPDARERLITSNLRLVVYVAKRFSGSGLQLVDLVQDGTLGLIRAADRFDWRRGCRFSTYATWWIRQAVQRGIHGNAETIRVPVHVREQMRELRALERQLLVELQREPTEHELADSAGLSDDEIREITALGDRGLLSLDEPVGEARTLAEAVPAAKSVEDEVEPRLSSEAVHAALERLPALESDVVRLRYGVDGGPSLTAADAGAVLGIGRDHVRRLEQHALKRLAWSPELLATRE